MVTDDISPPGAWAEEMKAAPWAFGQSQRQQVQSVLTDLRARGLWTHAETLEREIKTLQTELEYLRR
jgi:hypothetical protein